MKFVRANADKPHRCPLCWRVCTWDRPQLYWWSLVSCSKCDVWWFYRDRRWQVWTIRFLLKLRDWRYW